MCQRVLITDPALSTGPLSAMKAPLMPASFDFRRLGAGVLIIGTTLSFGACSKSQYEHVTVTETYVDQAAQRRQFTADGLIREELDLNGDGEIDSTVFYQPIDELNQPLEITGDMRPSDVEQYRILRRELDLNFDGRVDTIRRYDQAAEIDREEQDSDFDGVFDRITYYEDTVPSRRDIDPDGDGQPLEIRYYVEGHLFRIERDTNEDGQTDFWQFFDEGVLVRAGRDLDGDLVIDQWVRAEGFEEPQQESVLGNDPSEEQAEESEESSESEESGE